LPLPTTPQLIASLDEELVDLLYERMRLASMLRTTRTPEDVEAYVQGMRNHAAVYRASPDLVEKVARAILEAEALQAGQSR